MDTTTATQPPDAQSVTAKADVLVNVVLDRSGSMKTCRAGTTSGFNEYLKGLAADKETNFSVTLIQFDSPNQGPELTVSYTDRPLDQVPELDEKGFEPRGMTPLYDAVGECIRRVDAKGRAVLTVIITDGQENASREFNQDSIKKLLQEKETEGWKFIFLGANIDSAAVGGSMGIAVSDCANYSIGSEKALYNSMADSARRYAGAVRSFGMRSTEARMSASLTSEERSSISGGRPAAPPTFPATPQRPRSPLASNVSSTGIGTKPADPKRPEWKVRSEVSGS